MDAARAAHLPGIGQFGSGFLSPPKEIADKMAASGVKVVPFCRVLGGEVSGVVPALDCKDSTKLFPHKLGPFALMETSIKLELDKEANSYKVRTLGKNIIKSLK